MKRAIVALAAAAVLPFATGGIALADSTTTPPAAVVVVPAPVYSTNSNTCYGC